MVGRQGWHLKRDSGYSKTIHSGEDHYRWQGDQVSPDGGRIRARKMYDLGPCERCGKPATDRHHKNGNTANNHRANIEILCRRCHMVVDGRLEALVAMARQPRPIQPPKPCAICGRPYKPLRKGRCAACDQYRIRNGRDRELEAMPA